MPTPTPLSSRSPLRTRLAFRFARLVLAALVAAILPEVGAQAGAGGRPECPPGLAKKENGCQPPGHAKPHVLRVGTFRGIPGPFTTIQSAVDAAKPGDWILVGPGDYHERGDYASPGDEAGGGVTITKARIHLRGMDRNQVVIDGTRPGAPQCSSSPGDQDPGPANAQGEPLGRNGVLVFKADGVSVENLTACNFLDGAGGGGNEVWWNGGDGSGQIGMGPYHGQYLSATSTYFEEGKPKAEYGIFVSNSRGPGRIAHTYASNMADSSYYIGACPDCNAELLDAHAQNSALGYSGTNSGGHLLVAWSEWDGNKTGISTNSQNNDDAPSPQSGQCPDADQGIHGSGLCTYFVGNNIHDNNNPNVPASGSADLGPVGTGMVVSGGRFDTIAWNRFENNGSWAMLLVPFPDTGNPPPIANCAGGVVPQESDPFPLSLLFDLGVTCYFDDWGNEVYSNFFKGNGSFGNDTNGDLGELSELHDPGNCWHDNVDPDGVTSFPLNLQDTHGTCGVPNHGAGLLSPLSQQLICATGLQGPCTGLPGNPGYPQTTEVALLPLPKERPMKDPCQGVPQNPWCNKGGDKHDGHW